MHTISYLDAQGNIKEVFARPVERDFGRLRWVRHDEITLDSERVNNPFNPDALKRRGHDHTARWHDYEIPTRMCDTCHERKILDKYHFRLNGAYHRHTCTECEARKDRSRKFNKRNLPPGVRASYGNRQMNPDYT